MGGGTNLQSKQTVVIVLSLSRSGARNPAIVSLCLCVRPAAVVLCLRFRIALLQSALLVQLACPGKHSISSAVVFFQSFIARIFRVGRSMIEWRL